jgi:hypothetical protein
MAGPQKNPEIRRQIADTIADDLGPMQMQARALRAW